MRRVCIFGLATLVALSGVLPAQADWLRSWAQDARRNNAWPRPFIQADREAVWAPFSVMVMKGWERQNTLDAHHFNEDNELNEAGRRKVHQIVTTAPEQYRSIYIERDPNADVTAARVAAAQDIAARYATHREMPQVLETTIPYRGWPGEYADAIDSKYRDSQPEPRIPAMQNTSSSGS